MNESYNKEEQKELFPEFKSSSRRRFEYFKKDLTLGKKMILSISWENLVLSAIVFIMLLALFFSLGVEMGRTKIAKKIPAPTTAGAYTYTIQITALTKIEDAKREAARLIQAGYKTFLIQSGGLYGVCTGRYRAPSDAKVDLILIKEKYPSAYMRKVAN